MITPSQMYFIVLAAILTALLIVYVVLQLAPGILG